MGKKAMVYSAGLIALYLVVAYSTGFARAANATGAGGVNLVKAFQGR